MQNQQALEEIVRLCGGVLEASNCHTAIKIAPEGADADTDDPMTATPATLFVRPSSLLFNSKWQALPAKPLKMPQASDIFLDGCCSHS